MAEVTMPQPCRLGAPCRQAHELVDVEHRVVEVRLVPNHLYEQLLAGVEDAQDVVLDVDVVAHLVQLPKANDASLEAWDEVDTREGAVSAVLAR
jgi:hypothetical protein